MTDLIVEGPDGTTNLYGNWFERFNIPDVMSPRGNIAFDRRYIDDIFAIVYNDTIDPNTFDRWDIKKYMDLAIGFEGCTINWDVPKDGLAFLDLWVYIDGDNTIQWKPYRKADNNLERIPWESSHPTDIKRGTLSANFSD